MAKSNETWTATGTSTTDTLARQWDYLADSIIRENLHLSDDEIVALIRAQNGAKDAAWVRSRRKLLA